VIIILITGARAGRGRARLPPKTPSSPLTSTVDEAPPDLTDPVHAAQDLSRSMKFIIFNGPLSYGGIIRFSSRIGPCLNTGRIFENVVKPS
jgi:hypothetical protein